MTLPDLTPESMAKLFTPKEAAGIIWRTAVFRNAEIDPEWRKKWNELERSNPSHQWFCYCLDAVARRAGIHDE